MKKNVYLIPLIFSFSLTSCGKSSLGKEIKKNTFFDYAEKILAKEAKESKKAIGEFNKLTIGENIETNDYNFNIDLLSAFHTSDEENVLHYIDSGCLINTVEELRKEVSYKCMFFYEKSSDYLGLVTLKTEEGVRGDFFDIQEQFQWNNYGFLVKFECISTYYSDKSKEKENYKVLTKLTISYEY